MVANKDQGGLKRWSAKGGDMGEYETRVEGVVSAQQYVLDCERGLEKVAAIRVGKGLC